MVLKNVCPGPSMKNVFILILLVTVFVIYLFTWTVQVGLPGTRISFKQTQETSPRGNNEVPKPLGLLFLFTTWTLKKKKSLVYQKVLDTWRKLTPVIQPGVFSNELRIVEKARELGWKVHNVSEMECGGIPTLRSMFLAAGGMYSDTYPLHGFSNADILFDQSLIETVRHIVNQFRQTIQTKAVLVLLKRVNVNWQNVLFANVSDLSVFMKAGSYPAEGSSDLFITNSKFPWKKVPAFVVGRIGFGMWLVAFARASGVTVIDVTKTTRAIHVTTSAGIRESSGSEKAWCNHQLMNRLSLIPKSFKCGWIDCAPYQSEYDHSGAIVINYRKIPSNCHICNSSKHDVHHIKVAILGHP